MNKTPLILLVICVLVSCQYQPKNESKQEFISIGIKEKIYSKILEEEREIWIHTPEGFYGMNEQGMKYPVVYLVDGEIHFKSTVGLIDQFSSAANANDLCPQMIVVGIVNTNRNRDLTPTKAVIGKDSTTLKSTGGADNLAKFIAEELIPFIDQNYSTANHRTLIGHSFGGLFVLNTLIKYPYLFDNYLVIDPSMWWDDDQFSEEVLKKFSQKNNEFNKKSLYLATANNKPPWMTLSDVKKDTTEVINQMKSLLSFTEKLENLDKNGLSIQMKYYENESHGQVPLIATYDGFRFFYDDYPFQKMLEYYYPGSAQSKKDIAKEIKIHYDSLSKKYGYPVRPLESYINAYAFGLNVFENTEAAASLFQLNIENYPKSANVYASMGYFYLSQKDTLKSIEYFKKVISLKKLPHIVEKLSELTTSKKR